MGLKTWECSICGGTIIEGQRFTFIPGQGAVHFECLAESTLKNPSGDAVALLDANEVLLYTIVRLKEAARIARSEEIKNSIDNVRIEVERLAGILSKKLVEAVKG
ncbi:conserved hypothetical protein [Aeropyrum pernix]|uniref:DUF2175 domain-containing protein n=1 Tax=Aeropyrum pernix TaxID=56636 RepID=A0A401HBV6_AERPX|nr:DUF2175 family protein [Aeropyrum pernix]GBF09874.1 conserved hypothetical protein [Aeropyrum pernix]